MNRAFSIKCGASFRYPALIFTSILLVGSLPSALGQPSDAPLPFWRTDGPVHSILVTNGVTYIGGAFGYIGPDSGGAGVIDLTTAEAKRGFPIIDGTVIAAVPDASGGWYVGGAFTNVGGVVRTNLAHILADNTVDPLWIPHANGICRAMLLVGGQVYAGGAFTRVGGVVRNRLAALDPVTGAVATWNPNANNVVNALVLDGSATAFYVGGNFTTVGSSNRTRIAALNLATGLATAWNPSAGSAVNTIALGGNTVYVGGNFTTANGIGGQPRNRIAALDAVTGLATDWNPNIAGGGVSNIVVGASVAYAAGSFTSVGGVGRNCLAAIDLVTMLPTDWNPNPNTNVNVLLLTGNALYAGGAFTNISAVERGLIVALDLTNGTALPWTAVGSGLDLVVQPDVQAMSISGNQMLAGGSFRSIGGVVRKNIAAVANANGEATAWDATASGLVSALAFGTNTLYVGGSFTNIGGQSRNRLAALSDSTGEALEWNPDVRGRAGVGVLALAFSPNRLYAGGINITNVGGLNRTNLFAVSLKNGQPVAWSPPTFRTASAGSVNTLVIDDDAILVGGDFVSVGGQIRTNLGAVAADSGTVEAWSPNPNNIVSALAVSSNTVYAGGTFTTIGSVLRNRIAAVDRMTGLGILTFNPDASGASPRVSSMVLGDAVLYTGGQFNVLGGAFRTNAAAARLSNGQAAGWQPHFGALTRSIAVGENTIFVGGDFLTVGGKPHSYFAAFDAGAEILRGSLAVASGQFGFQIRSGEGSQVIVERSSNLTTWTSISTNPVTGSVIPFVDPQPVGADARFYRAVLSGAP